MTPDNDNLATDLLRGAEAIARFLGFPRRAVYHAVAKGHIPHFKIGEARALRLVEAIAHRRLDPPCQVNHGGAAGPAAGPAMVDQHQRMVGADAGVAVAMAFPATALDQPGG